VVPTSRYHKVLKSIKIPVNNGNPFGRLNSGIKPLVNKIIKNVFKNRKNTSLGILANFSSVLLIC
jgi:hypothetical protein